MIVASPMGRTVSHHTVHFGFERLPGFILSKRLGCDPNAQLIAFHACFEIWDKDLDQILPALIEHTEMSGPWNISESINACLPAFLDHDLPLEEC
jgi:hypothetical protein